MKCFGRGVVALVWVFACAFASVSPALSSIVIATPSPADIAMKDLLRSFPRKYMPPEMDEMCKLDAGKKIFSQTNDVSGYARVQGVEDWQVIPVEASDADASKPKGGCFPCFLKLLGQGYGYFETYHWSEQDLKRQHSFSHVGSSPLKSVKGIQSFVKYTFDGSKLSSPFGDGYADKTGYFRYRLIERDKLVERSGIVSKCARFDHYLKLIEHFEKHKFQKYPQDFFYFYDGYKKYSKKLGNRCVVAEPIQKFQASYYEVYDEEIIEMPPWQGVPAEILKTRWRMLNFETREVAARAIMYRYRLKVDVPYVLGNYLDGGTCGRSAPLKVHEILVPIKKGAEN